MFQPGPTVFLCQEWQGWRWRTCATKAATSGMSEMYRGHEHCGGGVSLWVLQFFWLDFYGFEWISMDFYGFLWIFMDFCTSLTFLSGGLVFLCACGFVLCLQR